MQNTKRYWHGYITIEKVDVDKSINTLTIWSEPHIYSFYSKINVSASIVHGQ